jgi:hypothetical protein
MNTPLNGEPGQMNTMGEHKDLWGGHIAGRSNFADLAVEQAGIPPPFVPVIPDTPQILMLSYRCMVKTSVTGIVR